MANSSDRLDIRPWNRGIKDIRIRIETATAAVASASSEVTTSVNSATDAATITARLRRVSAKTCWGYEERKEIWFEQYVYERDIKIIWSLTV